MKYIYCLRIDCVKIEPVAVSAILGVDCTKCIGRVWNYEIIEDEQDSHVDFVGKLLSIIDGKFKKLQEVGVDLGSISLWMYYEYDQQCNMEFSPSDLKRIGDSGLTFCISCWPSGRA